MVFLKQQLRRFWQHNSGYTTIELLIAMQLTFMIIGLAYSSYLFSRNLIIRWQEKIRIEGQLVVLSKTVSNHLWGIRQILQAKETEILAIKLSGDSLRLRLDEGVYINRDTLTISPLKIRGGKFIYFLRSEWPDDLVQSTESIYPEDLTNIAAIRVELSFNRKGKEYPFILFCRLLRIQPVISSG